MDNKIENNFYTQIQKKCVINSINYKRENSDPVYNLKNNEDVDK